MHVLETFCFNPFSENTYVLHTGTATDAFVIDPGNYTEAETEQLLAYLQTHQLRPKAILLTHAHVDHVLGLAPLQAAYPNLAAYVHADERSNFEAVPSAAAVFGLSGYVPGQISGRLTAGQTLHLGPLQLELRQVPGHAPGHVVFYLPDEALLLAGDTLFRESIGRTDLPGGNHETLLAAIRTQLYTLPDATRVCPGHGPFTHIGHERTHNPFVSGP